MSWFGARRRQAWHTALMLFASTLAALVPAGAARASVAPVVATSLADLSLEELGTIEITSVSRRAQALSDAAAAIYVITDDDIRRSGATSLPEALRLAPNLQIAELSNGRYAITARGFNGPEANKLLVLIDGRNVYSPMFAGVFWDIHDMVPQDIARIEVISGPGGTLWGLNAVNGVINIITKSAHETHGQWMAAGAGSAGADVWARHGGHLGENGAFRVHVHHLYRHRPERSDGDKVPNALRMSHAGFRADWSGAGRTLQVSGQLQQGEQERRPPGIIEVAQIQEPAVPVKTQGASLQARWSRHMPDGVEWTAQASVDHSERLVPQVLGYKLTVGDLQFQFAHPPAHRQSWVAGGAYRVAHNRVDNSGYIGYAPDTLTQEWLNLYAQNDITLRPDMSLTLGARLESNDYTGVEWLPNARLAWKATSDHLLWAALSRTVRAPSRIDMDVLLPYPASYPWAPGSGPRPVYLFSGGDVASEVAKVLEIGYRGQAVPDVSLSINVFRALYDKLRSQEAGGDAQSLRVSGSGMYGAVSGLEAWGIWQPTSNWRLSAGFTGLYQRFGLRPGSTDTEDSLRLARGRDPARTWLLRSALDLPGGHELDLMLRHVSSLPQWQVPSYLTADVRWGWRARPGVTLSVTGRNLLGKGHSEFLAAPTRVLLRPAAYIQAELRF